jgi:hypothetical protein
VRALKTRIAVIARKSIARAKRARRKTLVAKKFQFISEGWTVELRGLSKVRTDARRRRVADILLEQAR